MTLFSESQASLTLKKIFRSFLFNKNTILFNPTTKRKEKKIRRGCMQIKDNVITRVKLDRDEETNIKKKLRTFQLCS